MQTSAERSLVVRDLLHRDGVPLAVALEPVVTRRVLLTGATGFVGRELLTRLVKDEAHAVTVAVRRQAHLSTGDGGREVVVGEVTASTDWADALTGVDVVVHAAARAHVVRENAADPLRAFLQCNEAGTLALASQAMRAGVQRFLFVSSAKVHGECTPPGKPWRETQPFAPVGPYAMSKARAEEGLVAITRESGMQLVRVRPPLVYGPGVRANFLALIQAVRRGLPLPLASVDNCRSLVGLDNLVDFLVHCIDHPAAAGQALFVSDGEDVSTPELVRRVATAMGRSTPLWPMPVGFLRAGARLLRREEAFDRVCGNLQVDISAARELLGWRPPVPMGLGLEKAIEAQ